MRTLPTALSAIALTAALTAGCTAGGSDDTASGTGSDAGALVSSDGTAAGGAGGGGTADGSTVLDLRAVPGAAVVRTAELEVRVDDVAAAAEEAARLVRAAGGRVDAEDRSGSREDGAASLSLRVPPAALDRTVTALAALGDERSRRLGSEDVTEQVVDLEARLATQRASVDRVRALLREADALGEVVQVEGELTKRTADLEALQARLAALDARVDLATVTLRLDSDGGPVVAGGPLGFGDGLRAGWSALAATGRGVAVAAGALLPFLPLLLVGALVLRRVRPRRPVVVQP